MTQALTKFEQAGFIARTLITELVQKAEQLNVDDGPTADTAQTLIKQVKAAMADLADAHETATADMRAQLETADAAVKGFKLAVKLTETYLKDKVIAYKNKVAERKAALQAQAQALVAQQAPVAQQRVAIVAMHDATFTKQKGTAFIDNWKGEVIDATQVPQKYWVWSIDDKAIQADVKAGVRDIPGVRIWNDEYMRSGS